VVTAATASRNRRLLHRRRLEREIMGKEDREAGPVRVGSDQVNQFGSDQAHLRGVQRGT
jgi:hypothetical protein